MQLHSMYGMLVADYDAKVSHTRTGRRKHITSILRELHWLPIRHSVDFKLATFMYKTLHGQIPQYLSGDCQLISDASCRLWSSDMFTFASATDQNSSG